MNNQSKIRHTLAGGDDVSLLEFVVVGVVVPELIDGNIGGTDGGGGGGREI